MTSIVTYFIYELAWGHNLSLICQGRFSTGYSKNFASICSWVVSCQRARKYAVPLHRRCALFANSDAMTGVSCHTNHPPPGNCRENFEFKRTIFFISGGEETRLVDYMPKLLIYQIQLLQQVRSLHPPISPQYEQAAFQYETRNTKLQEQKHHQITGQPKISSFLTTPAAGPIKLKAWCTQFATSDH